MVGTDGVLERGGVRRLRVDPSSDMVEDKRFTGWVVAERGGTELELEPFAESTDGAVSLGSFIF